MVCTVVALLACKTIRKCCLFLGSSAKGTSVIVGRATPKETDKTEGPDVTRAPPDYHRRLIILLFMCVVCVVFSSHSFWTSSSLDVPAGEEEGHTGFLIHLLSAVRA